MDLAFTATHHAYEYMCCFEGRRSRIDINNFKSEWRDEILGFLQGWSPVAVAFVYFMSEFEYVDKKIDGVRLPCYADDITLISDGTVAGPALETNLNRAVEICRYIVSKKNIIFVPMKQKYFVLGVNAGEVAHSRSYFELVMGTDPIEKKFGVVRILRLRIDRKLS